MTGLVERLLKDALEWDVGVPDLPEQETADLLREAADRITELEAILYGKTFSPSDLDRAVEALRRIAGMYPDWRSERMALVRQRARQALSDITPAANSKTGAVSDIGGSKGQ